MIKKLKVSNFKDAIYKIKNIQNEDIDTFILKERPSFNPWCLYVADEIVEDIKNNNWFYIIGKYNFNANGFLNKYKDYLEYKKYI